MLPKIDTSHTHRYQELLAVSSVFFCCVLSYFLMLCEVKFACRYVCDNKDKTEVTRFLRKSILESKMDIGIRNGPTNNKHLGR